jgi:hypothetical protein
MYTNKSAASSTVAQNVADATSQRLSNAQIRAWIDQCLFSERSFTGERELSTQDKAVAIAIARYVNRAAGATYVDPLTISKALGIKHHAVKASLRNLGKAGRLTIFYKDGWITPFLVPVLKPNDNGLHSTRGDKAFYAARAKLTWRVMGDQRLTIAHRIAAIAMLSQVESGKADASQAWLSQIVDVSRPTMRAATAELEAHGYIERLPNSVDGSQVIGFHGLPGKQGGKEGGKSMSEKARQHWTSEHNYRTRRLSYVGDREVRDLVIEGQKTPSTLLKFPDTTAVSLWRGSLYKFLTQDDGPLGMILPAEMAKLVASGLIASNGEITALGHAIGADTSSLKREAA